MVAINAIRHQTYSKSTGVKAVGTGGQGGVEIRVAPDFDRSVLTLSPPLQLPGGLFSPSDICKKLSHHFLLHFPIGMDSYDHHVKYQGVFP